MDGRFDTIKVISKHMDWLSQRQKMLADTIADADTPDYLTHDLNLVAAWHVRADHRPAALVYERFIGR